MLSVIIITLNEEDNIPNILGDLLQQTMSDFEVILVDSNSDDGTVEVANSFKDKFKRFTVIENKIRGASLGRNTGADAASEERLLFLDADSRIKPNFIKHSLDVLKQTGVDVGGVYLDMGVGKLAHKIVSVIYNLGMWITKFYSPTGVGAALFSTRTAHNLVEGFNPNIPMADDCNYVLKTHKHKDIKFKMLPLYFGFDMRRMEEAGYVNILTKYAMVNIRRVFLGEYKKDEIEYKFGEYKKKSDDK